MNTKEDKRKVFTSKFEFENKTDIVWAVWDAAGFMAQITTMMKALSPDALAAAGVSAPEAPS